MTDRESARAALAQRLLAAAGQRFGAERADALKPAIETVAGQLADVAAFPLDLDETPAFFMDRRGPEAAR